MNTFEKILAFLDGEMPVPTWFGWYHILCLFILAGITFCLVKFYKNSSDKTFRNIILITWIVITVLEIYKQLNYSFDVESATWSYDWYYFPFQFCSTPLYVLPFIVFLKDGKLRDACMAFTMSYAMFAGLAVMVYPGDVYTENLGINIQTMVHHASQVFIGIFVAVHERKKFSKKFFLSATFVFAIVLIIALLFNVLGHVFVPEQRLNMFFIGPYDGCKLPILNVIYPVVPWILFFFIYFIGFSLIAMLVCFIANLIYVKGKGNNDEKQNG